ncbi:MAG TPA: phage holin family protein [Thermoanaerobaculia bacterium]
MATPDRYPVSHEHEADERSIGELLSDLTRETRTLIRQEIELATTELSEKAARKGKDLGMMAAGGFLAYAGALVLLAALVIGLGHLIGYGWAALLVGIVVTGAGAILILGARKDMQKTNLSPDRTKRSIKETKLWLKEQTR